MFNYAMQFCISMSLNVLLFYNAVLCIGVFATTIKNIALGQIGKATLPLLNIREAPLKKCLFAQLTDSGHNPVEVYSEVNHIVLTLLSVHRTAATDLYMAGCSEAVEAKEFVNEVNLDLVNKVTEPYSYLATDFHLFVIC